MTPPPPPRETDRPEASAKPKRAWSKPPIKNMSYATVIANGPQVHSATVERPAYRPPT